MNPERMEARIQEIRTLLSHIGSELSLLEQGCTHAFRATSTDDLTGCLRRNAFLEDAAALAREEALGPHEVFAILMLDLDHFKNLNDRFGHAVGDEVLSRVAGVLLRFSSLRCRIGRWGGEEFVLAFRGNPSEATMLAECVRSQIEALLFPQGFSLTASLGLASRAASVAREEAPVRVLIEEADRALYRAKNSGRNRVCAA